MEKWAGDGLVWVSCVGTATAPREAAVRVGGSGVGMTRAFLPEGVLKPGAAHARC